MKWKLVSFYPELWSSVAWYGNADKCQAESEVLKNIFKPVYIYIYFTVFPNLPLCADEHIEFVNLRYFHVYKLTSSIRRAFAKSVCFWQSIIA